MVANYSTGNPVEPQEPATDPAARPGMQERGLKQALPEFWRSLLRVGKLQGQIWTTRAKMKVANALISAALLSAAGVVALLAIIFLYIGVFHLLTDIAHLQRTWVYLIYFAVHVAGAVVLVSVARAWNRKNKAALEGKHHV
jgi:hypothetical protein